MPTLLPQCMLSRSGTSPVPCIIYVDGKEPLCACSAATSPASPGIWQVVPLTTLMEIPAKQAVAQIPLSSWKEARLGKPRRVVDPQTWTINESTLVSPGEVCTTENASQATRKCYCAIYFKSLTSSLILRTYSFQTDLHRVN